jgi:hypothetical protein
MSEHGKREGDTEYGKRFDDHTMKQMLRSWPVIVSIVGACWILYGKLDAKFEKIDTRQNNQDIWNGVMDTKLTNIQENVKLLLKR